MFTLNRVLVFTKHAFWRGPSIAVILSLLCSSVALAASGTLDTTFSGDGKQTTDFASHWTDIINAIAIQSDGKIVAVGDRFDPAHRYSSTRDFAVARYNTNGSLDSTFSGDGKQLTDFLGLDDAMGVAIQPDGKIVVSGETCDGSLICDLAVARYNKNGSLDKTFNGGKKVVDEGGKDNGSLGGVAIQPLDGKIVIAGYKLNAAGTYDFSIYRLNSNGTSDTTFDTKGWVAVDFGASRNDSAYDLVLQPNGKIVAVGETCDSSYANCNFAIARLNANGVLDATFSGDGKQTTDLGGNDEAYGVARQSDGKLVVVGKKGISSTTSYCAIVRYTSSGGLDATFGSGGKKIIQGIGAAGCGANDVVVQSSNGKIVVAGTTWNGANHDFALFRLNPTGSLDNTFSGDGKVAVDFGHDDFATALRKDSNGKYVVGGWTDTGTQMDFALARVLP